MAEPEKGVGIAALLSEPSEDAPAAPDEKVRAARSLLSAIASKDAQGVADAFDDLYHRCADASRPSSPDLEDDFAEDE